MADNLLRTIEDFCVGRAESEESFLIDAFILAKDKPTKLCPISCHLLKLRILEKKPLLEGGGRRGQGLEGTVRLHYHSLHSVAYQYG